MCRSFSSDPNVNFLYFHEFSTNNIYKVDTTDFSFVDQYQLSVGTILNRRNMFVTDSLFFVRSHSSTEGV